MLMKIVRIFVRKVVHKMFVGRSKLILLPLLLLVWCLLVWHLSWWLVMMTSDVLMYRPPLNRHHSHFRRNSSLAYYMDSIQLLIEPSSTPCAILEEVPVIIMVASAPGNFESRLAVRDTWAKYQPTFFVLGLHESNLNDDQLADTYIEAKQHGDMVVFDFLDHYHNLTLKTALMIHWTMAHCPQAQFMLKTDDDVLVNPWTLKNVMKDNRDAKLVGYKMNNWNVHRDVYSKWYVPRWMYHEDTLPQYLAGPCYIISGEYLQKILKAAYRVPLVSLEDVYFTYIVAYKKLGLSLSHDRRLSCYKPWLGLACAYWGLASVHSLSPDQMLRIWSKIERIASKNSSCSFFNNYINSELLLY